MNDVLSNPPALSEELLALSCEDVLDALDREDEVVSEAVSQCIGRYAEQVGVELKAGRDYLPLLTPDEDTPGVLAVAMEMVLEAVEEEFEELEDE